MGTTILSFEDRIVIETLRHEKQSLRYIADYLGFSKTTIFNEIYRLKGEYHATSAQADHETKLSYRGRKCSLTVNLKRLIEGTNNKIKVIKRTAYDYRNFFHFRIRILVSLKTSNLMIRELSKKRTRPIAKVA